MSQVLLPQSCEDGITSLTFGPQQAQNQLLVSSWDAKLHLYDVEQERLLTKLGGATSESPILDATFNATGSVAYAACLDNSIAAYDVSTQQQLSCDTCTHTKSAKCVEFDSERSQLLSGSWSGALAQHDARAKSIVAISQHTANPSHKIFAMSLLNDTLVVCTSHRTVYLYDLRKSISQPSAVRSSSLLHQTRCVKLFEPRPKPGCEQSPSLGLGFALSSIEGRIAIDYCNTEPEAQHLKYAFKCHRGTDAATGQSLLYPINALAFHPVHASMASGGCDGNVSIWDVAAKKRICQYKQYDNSIAALQFNTKGNRLAVASSYTFEQGEESQKMQKPNQVFVRSLAATEFLGKQAQQRQ